MTAARNLVALVATAFLVLPTLALAGEPVSQWLAKKASDDGITKVTNPMPWEMFALIVRYEIDGSFSGCDGLVVPPRGTADDCNESDCETSGRGGVSEEGDDDGYIEILSVPTEGNKRGKTSKGVGLHGRNHKEQMKALDPNNYELSSDSSVRNDVVDCACSELSDAGLPKGLLGQFGIKC